MAATLNVETSTTRRNSKPRRHRIGWILGACLVAGLLVAWTLLLTVYWPFTRQAAIDALQERSLRTVTIGKFQRTYFPPGFVAEQINFLHIKRKDRPPLITLNKLVVTTTYPLMLTFQRRLANVHIEGLHIMVPAKESAGQPSPLMPFTYSTSGKAYSISNLYANGAILDFYRETTTTPLRFTIHHLAMRNIDTNTPFTYKVQFDNSEPPGIITSEGSFGPWNPNNPGATPLRGNFRYDNVNLGFFGELAGTLSSSGKFEGNLGRVSVRGSADVPAFRLADTSHQRRLAVNYQAAVNGTNGDVELSGVTADFDRTSLTIKGAISGVRGQPGKSVSLDLSSSRARIEDLMNLFISGKHAPMTGNLTLHLHTEIPSHRGSFLSALTANGSFGIAGGKFADQQTEQGLTKLSDSTAKGKAEQANEPMVLSGLTGQVAAGNGVAHLSHIEFQIPGARAWLNGTFGLINHQTDMHGVLITTGNVSETETGFKSFLLKALTPFLKRTGKDHAKVVHFKVTGPYGRVSISLDLDPDDQQEPRRKH